MSKILLRVSLVAVYLALVSPAYAAAPFYEGKIDQDYRRLLGRRRV